MFKLILEGPDNAGKTTLAKSIVGDHTYFHPGGRPADDVAEDACMREQMSVLLKNEFVLMDRCTPISQSVYTPNPARNLIRLENFNRYRSVGALVVYCRPSTDALMSFESFTWREGETEEFKQEIIHKQHEFIQRYDDLMQKLPHVAYDFRADDAGTVRDMLAKAFSNDRSAQHFIRNLPSYRATRYAPRSGSHHP